MQTADNKEKKNSKRATLSETLRKIILLVLLAAVVAIEIWYRMQSAPSEVMTDCYNSFSRLAGGLVALILRSEFSFEKILDPRGNKKLKALIFIIPAFAVAINNFPWVSFFAGDCTLDASAGELLFFAFICLCVGLFEELAFRGCALMLFLKKRRHSKLGVFMAIFWSSVIFGAVHLVNIFISSPGAVLLQIGYSALIGGLCCVVLLETGNIWICVVVHALYNFAGGVVPRLGEGVIWTASEVAITAIIGVIVAALSVWRFIRMPLSLADTLFKKKAD